MSYVNDEAVQRTIDKVAQESAEFEQTRALKERAEDEVLIALVRMLKPVLRDMASKVPEGAGPVGQAVFVDKTYPLFLGVEGDWFTIESGKVQILGIGEVLERFNVEAIIESLLIALYAQDGAREKATAKINKEKVKLDAIITLLAAPAYKSNNDDRKLGQEARRLRAVSATVRDEHVARRLNAAAALLDGGST